MKSAGSLMAHECADHHRGKAKLTAFWSRRGFHTISEAGCDVLAWGVKDGTLQFVFCEYERSTRNVVRNCQRNQIEDMLGRTKFLIVVPTEELRYSIRKLLRQYLSPTSARRIGIALLRRLEA